MAWQAALAAAAGNIAGGLMSHQLTKDWERKKMTHGYRWAMGDLRAAGLNPILAYTQGPAKASGAGGPNFGELGTTAVSNYRAQKLFQEQLKQEKEKTKQAKSQTYIMAMNELRPWLEMNQIKANTAQTVQQTQIAQERFPRELELLIKDVETAVPKLKGAKAEAYLKDVEARLYKLIEQELGGGEGTHAAKGGSRVAESIVKMIMQALIRR
jgi:hypothetical protein